MDIDDVGIVTIFSPDGDALEQARAMIEELTQEAELDRVYLGKVKRITDFGAFVEIFPGTDGLIHISHLADGRVEKVTDVLTEGDEVLAKCIDIDPTGRIRLSRKEALADAAESNSEGHGRGIPRRSDRNCSAARRGRPAPAVARDALVCWLRPVRSGGARGRRTAPGSRIGADRLLHLDPSRI